MEDIYICCGLGDCLLYCQMYDLYRNTFKYQYVLNKEWSIKVRSEKYLQVIQCFFNFFKVPLKICYETHFNTDKIFNIAILLRHYPIIQNTLINYIPNILTNLPIKYIVININIRFANELENSKEFDNIIDNICYNLNNVDFNIPVVIIGHKQTFQNFDVINYSFYDKLIHKKFIDKTYDFNSFNEPNMDNLMYDINIIKNAEETFQFGFGGSLCLNICFSNKLTAFINNQKLLLPDYFSTRWFDNLSNVKIYNDYYKPTDLLNKYKYIKNNNILYLLGHKTLTEFELPILIDNNYGVFMSKNISSLNSKDSIYTNVYKYDYTLKDINKTDLDKINNIDWFSNQRISNEIMNIINNNFNIIFITLLTSDDLLEQFITCYTGTIYYRFFGREGTLSYKNLIDKYISPKIKYIFSYPEIYNYEITLKNTIIFNSHNSYVIPLGIPNYILKYEKTYNPSYNKICFVCSKINICTYFTNIYNTFIDNLGNKYPYILLGKNNEKLNDENKINNLNDDDYYKTISGCKLLYYHSEEERHLHYHPLEAIIIGIPIIFYEKSLLNRYLFNSPGKCKNINDVYLKINRILNNDTELINQIIFEQNKIVDKLKVENNKNIFDNILNNTSVTDSYDMLINILNINNYCFIVDNNNNTECIANSIGDILFKLVNLQENLVSKPVYINLELYRSGCYMNINTNTTEPIHWIDNSFNNVMFRIQLLNNIIENSNFFEKKDFIFVITDVNKPLVYNMTFNYRLIKNYKILMDNNFYTDNTFTQNIENFIKTPFIIFHTKLQLNSSYNYNKIKEHLSMFFSGLKIHKYNIILLGEQIFIPTIYPELLKLYNYNSDKILDLTKKSIHTNYQEYKNYICLIHKATYNICYGQGDQLCSALLFGKCIFFNPIDIDAFYKNTNLYNSGHRYFKRLDMINKYLLGNIY